MKYFFRTDYRGMVQLLTDLPALHAYLAGLIDSDFGCTNLVGGTDDHVHILCDLLPTLAVADFMRRLNAI